MLELARGLVWQASLRETEGLVSPEAMGAYGRYRIQAVLTVAHDVRPRCVAALPQLALPVREDAYTPGGLFDLACLFGQLYSPLLVHCNAGANRSRVFAAAILHKLHQVSLERALAEAEPPAGPCLDSFMFWARGGA